MIVQQCENCSKEGKNIYCNNCIKVANYFDVYTYDNTNRSDKGRIKGRIKAYTWHDVLEYIKYNFFDERSKGNLNINCEKDFAYLEVREAERDTIINSARKSQGEYLGYKVYLIDENKSFESRPLNDRSFWDLTTVTPGDSI